MATPFRKNNDHDNNEEDQREDGASQHQGDGNEQTSRSELPKGTRKAGRRESKYGK